MPVLLNPILEALCPDGKPPPRFVDGTLGAGGHTRALLEAGTGEVLGLDLDRAALEIASQRLALYSDRTHLVHASYTQMKEEAARLGWYKVDAILLDVGVSSMQLDRPERGFSFLRDGALDMRFDPSGTNPSAAELVNLWGESDLAEIFFTYGEERNSRRLAGAIVKNRPYETTLQLATIIEQNAPREKRRDGKRIHPATRIFQALRIAVNDELGAIERVLPSAIELLNPGGRLAVISFHSLEDRIVKQTFKDASEEIISPPGMQLAEKHAIVRQITRKPIEATEVEIAQNPRSRSAKLRVAEKL
ncbi:MAG: 16S rRNA (cytosine(1402)-N(4))-methyltransferase RsmH [Chitinophagaceae bacterium]|nr:16S rRNA (cytosine(1402)-N(4))-methyltransferase RsmH [Anaerolineae bacterium]